MGSALATALFNKGFGAMIRNRTASKTEPLSRIGLGVTQSVPEAVNEADVIIVNINDYNLTLQLLQHRDIESALPGKILVQLSSGTPNEAKEMEARTYLQIWGHEQSPPRISTCWEKSPSSRATRSRPARITRNSSTSGRTPTPACPRSRMPGGGWLG
jgi:hypothetical protein